MQPEETIAQNEAFSMKYSIEPTAHYDRVTEAWRYLIGEDLHLGYFKEATDGLSKATEALTDSMAEAAQLGPGLKILDIGCGTGSPAALLASKWGCRVVGISTSKVGVVEANAKAKAAGFTDQLFFRVADALQTGYRDGSFDRIWVMESSHLIPQKGQLLQECVRIVRSGGKIALCDIVLRRHLDSNELFEISADMRTVQEVFGRANTQSLNFYEKTLGRLGLTTEVNDISEYVLPTFDHWRDNAERYGNIVEGILGREELNKFTLSCEILARFFRSGLLGYGIVVSSKSDRNPKSNAPETCKIF